MRTPPLLTAILLFLAVAAFSMPSVAVDEASNDGIAQQLNIIQKIRDYNSSLAESTLRNVTFLVAFLGGILSFLAPCTVALFPAFLANVAKSRNRSVTLATLVFFAGFAASFVAIGIVLTSLGKVSFAAFQQDAALLVRLAGIVLVFLGALTVAGRGFSFFRFRAGLPHDMPGTFAFGAVFAIGWSACVGPIIAGVFTMAAVFNNYLYTALLLFFYALGLAVPLFAAAFLYDKFNLANSRLVQGFLLRLKIGGRELVFSSTNIIAGLLLAFLGLFFIINRGTTAITSADLLGKIALLAVVSGVAYMLHRFVVARWVKSSNLAKIAAVAEILAAIAAFSFITHKYNLRTTGMAELLSRAVLEKTRLFSIIAGAVLIVFAAALLYFAKKQVGGKKEDSETKH